MRNLRPIAVFGALALGLSAVAQEPSSGVPAPISIRAVVPSSLTPAPTPPPAPTFQIRSRPESPAAPAAAPDITPATAASASAMITPVVLHPRPSVLAEPRAVAPPARSTPPPPLLRPIPQPEPMEVQPRMAVPMPATYPAQPSPIPSASPPVGMLPGPQGPAMVPVPAAPVAPPTQVVQDPWGPRPVPMPMPGYAPAHAPAGAPAAPCCPSDVCGPEGRFWIGSDALLWWVQRNRLPALVTGSPVGTAQAQAGVLGNPNTQTLFGGDTVGEAFRVGPRFFLGYWLDEAQTCGLEASYFFLSTAGARYSAGGNGDSVVARPFFDATTGQPVSELVSFPGVVAGTVNVDYHSSILQGAEAGLRKNCYCCEDGRIDLLVGYRFLRLGDRLSIREDLTSLDPNLNGGTPTGTRFLIHDEFETTNLFHGGYAGVAGEYRFGAFVLGVNGKLSLGYNERHLRVGGSTDITVPGFATLARSGGLLALPSNIGTYRNASPIFVPEGGLTLGVQLTPHIRLRAGYSFLYWNRLWRPGQQIDTAINRDLLPPANAQTLPIRPAAPLSDTSLWAQGIDLGAEVRF